jgi:organic hydroperoxide reductase OsmC/OhrA
MSEQLFSVTLERRGGYAFTVNVGELELTVDESPPLGGGQGPNPKQLFAAAIGNCLAASLLFCLGKARIPVGDLTARVTGQVIRNPAGRLRIGELQVVLSPELAEADVAKAGRCATVFEDFCLVTQSVREGVDVRVTVSPVASVDAQEDAAFASAT